MSSTSKKKPARSIRLVRPPSIDGVGVFCVVDGKHTFHYTLREIPCSIGGRGFAVHRLGLGNLYHVHISDDDPSCECRGFLYHGYCKHVTGLLALIQAGKL
jgi:SWIM zinc finger